MHFKFGKKLRCNKDVNYLFWLNSVLRSIWNQGPGANVTSTKESSLTFLEPFKVNGGDSKVFNPVKNTFEL